MHIGHKHKWFNETPELLNCTLTYETFHAINKQLLLTNTHTMCTFNKRKCCLYMKTRNQILKSINSAVKCAIEPLVTDTSLNTNISDVIGLPITNITYYNNVFELLHSTTRDISYHLNNAIADGYVCVEMSYKFKIGFWYFGVSYQLVPKEYATPLRKSTFIPGKIVALLRQCNNPEDWKYVNDAIDTHVKIPYWWRTRPSIFLKIQKLLPSSIVITKQTRNR